jgi:predicted TIM-barrel fold metal-dependent hydrolase
MALTDAKTAQLMFAEVLWFGHRPLWILAFGGVFDRHPGLKVAFTEQHQDWIPGTLKAMDYDMAETAGGVRRQSTGTLGKELVSTYWKRNCFDGASLLSRCELEMRYEIGVDKMMYGTDFAHREGTFNKTLQYLQALFGHLNVSEAETRMILGKNAATVFGFDEAALAPVVERCGFTIDEILTPPTGPLDRDVEITMRRPAKGW